MSLLDGWTTSPLGRASHARPVSRQGGKMANFLVTGGTGYIGSHTCVELLGAGHDLTVIDNLCNSSVASLDAVQQIANRGIDFAEVDLRDRHTLERLFADHSFDAVIHFAGLKAVGESVKTPLAYFDNNVTGTLNLLGAMKAAGVRTLVFSSSATVYGEPDSVPIDESFPTGATNPYGRTKLMIEEILRDLHVSAPDWRISILRYFNPVGADSSGDIGETPRGTPNNLMPYIAQVAVGTRSVLQIFGDDYDTPDGTGVRDYIHVVDLAKGHLAALDHLQDGPRLAVHNLGTGKGYSVLDVVRAFEAASGRPVPFEIVNRRPGDVAACFADPTKANQELGWSAEHDLDAMCRDTWRWQKRHPDGFASGPS